MAHDYIRLDQSVWLQMSTWLKDEAKQGVNLVMSSAGVLAQFQSYKVTVVGEDQRMRAEWMNRFLTSVLEYNRKIGNFVEHPGNTVLTWPSADSWSSFRNQFFTSTTSKPANLDWPYIQLLVANNTNQFYRFAVIAYLFELYAAAVFDDTPPASSFTADEVTVLKAIAEQWRVND